MYCHLALQRSNITKKAHFSLYLKLKVENKIETKLAYNEVVWDHELF